MRLLAAVAVALVLLAGQGRADAPAIAREAARLLAEAQEALEAAEDAPDRRRALTLAIRAYETGLVAANAGLAALTAEREAAAERLSGHGRALADIHSALRQIEAVPPALRLQQPGGAVAAARAAGLLAHLQPQIRAWAADLAAELDEVATMSALQTAFVDEIRTASAEVAAARTMLSGPQEADARISATLGRTARDLASLARSLEGQENASFEQTPDGAWAWPVAGEIRRDFGEADGAGIERPGLVLSAASGALVTAPVTGTVRFTGPFLTHGQVVILAPGGERLLVLAGMARVLVSPGELVQMGAPLGLMPGGDTDDEDFLIVRAPESDAFLNQSLYVEFRRSGIAENPVAQFVQGAGRKGSR